MEKLTSGKLAKMAGINIESIRFYERKGLMPKPIRSDSGYRLYAIDDVKRIKFIKKAQKLGFTLKEINELLNLRIDEHNTCADVQMLIIKKTKEIELKIKEMKKIDKTLKEMQKLCSTNELEKECPFLDILNKN